MLCEYNMFIIDLVLFVTESEWESGHFKMKYKNCV